MKEPYYRQLNPQPAAAWPEEQQQEEVQQAAAQQQPYAQQNDMTQMQQAAYGWPAPQEAQPMQGYPEIMQQPSHGRPGRAGTHQWSQQQMYQQQMWQ